MLASLPGLPLCFFVLIFFFSYFFKCVELTRKHCLYKSTHKGEGAGIGNVLCDELACLTVAKQKGGAWDWQCLV